MHQERLLHHLKQLVAMYPKCQDPAATQQALDYCRKILVKSGNFADMTIHEDSGYYSLTASTKHTKTPKLLLQAHIDVVPCSDPPAMELHAKSETITGRGVYDMLFAAASYLTFVEEHQSDLSSLDIGIMLTGDEEIGGFHGVAYLLEQDYGGEVCFLPDAGNGFGDLSTACKGVYNFDLMVRGKAHHGSRPWEGDGAANKLIYLLNDLLAEFDETDKSNSTMTITGLTGGDATNRAPNRASAHLDIRYKDAADIQRIKKAVSAVCEKYQGQLENVMEADCLALDMDNPRVQDFLKLYEKRAGQAITLSKAHGGSDARFFAARGIPVIMLRPDGSGAHGDHETLSLPSLEKFYLLLEDYILDRAKT